MKKVLTWALVAFLIWYVVTRPNDAANVLRQIGSFLASMARGFGSFVSNLA